LVKNSKASSWKNYVTRISNQTDFSKVWQKIKSIKGINRTNAIHLLCNTKLSTSPNEVANTLGALLQKNSSNINYDQDFIASTQRFTNPTNTADPSDITQTQLNLPLKFEELEDTLQK
jgi:hypothetical protein